MPTVLSPRQRGPNSRTRRGCAAPRACLSAVRTLTMTPAGSGMLGRLNANSFNRLGLQPDSGHKIVARDTIEGDFPLRRQSCRARYKFLGILVDLLVVIISKFDVDPFKHSSWKGLGDCFKNFGVSSRRRLMTFNGLGAGIGSASFSSTLGDLTRGFLGVGITVTTCLAGDSSIGAGRACASTAGKGAGKGCWAGSGSSAISADRDLRTSIFGTLPAALTFLLVNF